MTEEKKKTPSVPEDCFTSSYQHLVNANYLFPKGGPGAEADPNRPYNQGSEILSGFKPQSYGEEVSLWLDTSDILKSLIDQETKTMVAQKIVGV